jgi:hypothetical protein
MKEKTTTPLRQRMIEDMHIRGLCAKTQQGHIRAAGHTSLRAMAAELTTRGIRTRRGRAWHVSNVKELLGRLAQKESERWKSALPKIGILHEPLPPNAIAAEVRRRRLPKAQLLSGGALATKPRCR